MRLKNDWINGFVDGEGCFYVGINNNDLMALKVQVLPEFAVVKHKRDVKVLYDLKDFFKCGLVKKNRDNRMCYVVRKLKDLFNIIIPFFEKCPLMTTKNLIFYVFVE